MAMFEHICGKCEKKGNGFLCVVNGVILCGECVLQLKEKESKMIHG